MLKYIGNSALPGVPARDLTDSEVRKFGKTRLIMSGLYIEPETKMKTETYENKTFTPKTAHKAKEQ